MAVGADQRLAGLAEALHVDRMADAVARPRVPDPESAAGRAQEHVLIRVELVVLDKVVVDVLRRETDLDALDAHRLQLKHDEAAEHVLQEGLVDPESDLAARGEVALGEVGLDELLRQVQRHRGPPS